MVSSVKRTSFTRSPGLTSEPFIPLFHNQALVFLEHTLYAAKFYRTESQVAGQRDGIQPELGRLVLVDRRAYAAVRWARDCGSRRGTDPIAEQSARSQYLMAFIGARLSPV